MTRRNKRFLSLVVGLALMVNMGTASSLVFAEDTTEETSAVTTEVDVTEESTETEVEESETETETEVETTEEETEAETEKETEKVTEADKEDTKGLTVTGGAILLTTSSGLDVSVFKGFSYKLINVTDNKTIFEGKIDGSESGFIKQINLEKCTFDSSKEYKVEWGRFPESDMRIISTDIIAYNVHEEESYEVTFRPLETVDESGKECVMSPCIKVMLGYGDNTFLRLFNRNRQLEPIVGGTVNVEYNGGTKVYTTDKNGYVIVPVYDGNWDMTVSGSMGDGHVLYETDIAGTSMFGGSDVGTFDYTLTWDDGDTFYNIWGYDADCSAKLDVKINHNGDTSLFPDFEPSVMIGVKKKGSSDVITNVMINGEGEVKVPALEKGEYELTVLDNDGYEVKLSSTIFKADEDTDNITVTLEPMHYLTVVKKMQGQVVKASFTINEKSYETDDEYTFETHPTASFVVIDNETKEEYNVDIPWGYRGVVLTMGDNPSVDVVGAIEDGTGNGSSGSLVGSNGNPKTFDKIAGIVVATVSVVGVAGAVIYRKKKSIKM